MFLSINVDSLSSLFSRSAILNCKTFCLYHKENEIKVFFNSYIFCFWSPFLFSASFCKARACYAKASVVLLDDPLSAVDPSVAKHLFLHCIKGWLVEECKCAVVLVTHQRQFLKAAHRVVLLETMRKSSSSSSHSSSLENECGPPLLSMPNRQSKTPAVAPAAADTRLKGAESGENVGRMVANGTFEQLLAMRLIEDVSVALDDSHTNDNGDSEVTPDDHDHCSDDDHDDVFDPLFGASAPGSLTALTASVAVTPSPSLAETAAATRSNQIQNSSISEDHKASSSSTTRSNSGTSASSGAGGVLELVHKEDREVGVVSRATWWAYVSASGVGWALLVLCFFVAGQACLIVSDWWLVVWAKADNQRASHLLYTFVALCVTTVVVSFSRAWLFFFTTLKASSALHQGAATSLFASPLSFFAATPSGRILNRFSADLAQVLVLNYLCAILLPHAPYTSSALPGSLIDFSHSIVCFCSSLLLSLFPSHVYRSTSSSPCASLTPFKSRASPEPAWWWPASSCLPSLY